ncbi:dynein 8 kDa light chain, flagellar outer arm-like [Cicer arietinum]|uniref:Dynein light chain n=1 Tax=Cicer arietinum TaxID=3827 RepID=A0A1S2XGY8_CICAR|nr:dynein 8 kDa light chain, flagellar outer arm-like [Cicer arietinum]
MTRGKKKNIDAGDPTENSLSLPVPVSNTPPPPSIPPKKIFIINADMTQEMQWEAFDIAVTVFEKNHNLDTVTAEEIKTEFDRRHGPSWHCIVGSNFGSHVTHEPNHFVNFYLEQKAVLLYKYG